MRISKRLLLGVTGAAVVAIAVSGGLIAQAARGGPNVTAGVSTVLQNGCSHMVANTETSQVQPNVYPGTVVAARQVYMLCNSAVVGWFTTETLAIAPVPPPVPAPPGVAVAGASLGVKMRATCVAPQVSAGCIVGTQLYGGPATDGGFATMSFLRFDAENYMINPYINLWPQLTKGHWLFETIVANSSAATPALIEYRSMVVQTGYIPSAQ